MTNKLKCPFCQQELKELYINGFPVGFRCKNKNCPKTNIMCGTKELWQELVCTRKAFDVANEKLRHCVNITVEELDELKGNLLIAYNALLHFSKDPIANNALEKITTLVQKDVK